MYDIVGLKLFGKAHVEVNVSLGQLINNPLFNEADSEFHVSSYFKTKIDIRNALHVSITYVFITNTPPVSIETCYCSCVGVYCYFFPTLTSYTELSRAYNTRTYHITVLYTLMY